MRRVDAFVVSCGKDQERARVGHATPAPLPPVIDAGAGAGAGTESYPVWCWY